MEQMPACRWVFLTAAAVCLLGVVAVAGPPAPRKVLAVLDATQSSWSSTKCSVCFYDVTDLAARGLNQQPMFAVWTGYEDTVVANLEDPGAIAVNPVNGTVYVLAYDSGPPGEVVASGDTRGDYDLYRIDYQEIYQHWLANGAVYGAMYAPKTSPDAFENIAHPDHPNDTVFIDGAICKAGEVQRSQNGPMRGFSCDLDFVNPGRLVLLDNQEDDGENTEDYRVADHQIRGLQRVDLQPGAATASSYQLTDTDPLLGARTITVREGGYNGQTAESWESRLLAILNLTNDETPRNPPGTVNDGLDYISTAGDFAGRSEPEDIQYHRDPATGTEGVWMGESDGGGDDIAFLQISNWNGRDGNTYKEMRADPNDLDHPTSFVLDQDPTVDPTSNDGSHDWLKVDKDGNLIVGESGYFDTPKHEPAVITRQIRSYDAPDSDADNTHEIEEEIVFGDWGRKGPIAPGVDDDTVVTDGRFVAYDKGANQVYYFDPDSGSAPDVVTDLYVFDLDDGTLVYEELNAVNNFIKQHGLEVFVRGDVDGDGAVGASDIDALYGLVNGGPDALTSEWYDLTGESPAVLDGDDVGELVRGILGTEFGDANLDGKVGIADLGALADNYGLSAGAGWAQGDFNGDGKVGIADLGALADNYGAGGGAPAVPEPAGLTLLTWAAWLTLRRRARPGGGRRI